jgi:hypothetical protein
MNITNAKYFQFDGQNVSIKCTVDGKNVAVPLDPANTDYQAILEWAKIDGNTIEDAD